MKQDDEDEREAMRRAGVKLPPETSQYEDDSFDEEVLQGKQFVHEGDDPADIARQVAAMSDPAYNKQAKKRLEFAKPDKDPAALQVEENLKRLKEKMAKLNIKPDDKQPTQEKMKQFDQEDDFPEI